MGDEQSGLRGYGRPVTSTLELTRGAKASAQRHPLPADTVLAVALAVAALVSLDTVYGEIPANDTSYSHGWTAGVVISILAITLPLAGGGGSRFQSPP